VQTKNQSQRGRKHGHVKLESSATGCRTSIGAKGFYEKRLGFSLDHRLRRRRGLTGDLIHPSRFGGVDHIRQGNHFRRPGSIDD